MPRQPLGLGHIAVGHDNLGHLTVPVINGSCTDLADNRFPGVRSCNVQLTVLKKLPTQRKCARPRIRVKRFAACECHRKGPCQILMLGSRTRQSQHRLRRLVNLDDIAFAIQYDDAFLQVVENSLCLHFPACKLSIANCDLPPTGGLKDQRCQHGHRDQTHAIQTQGTYPDGTVDSSVNMLHWHKRNGSHAQVMHCGDRKSQQHSRSQLWPQ